jgi:hypothetical protein
VYPEASAPLGAPILGTTASAEAASTSAATMQLLVSSTSRVPGAAALSARTSDSSKTQPLCSSSTLPECAWTAAASTPTSATPALRSWRRRRSAPVRPQIFTSLSPSSTAIGAGAEIRPCAGDACVIMEP